MVADFENLGVVDVEGELLVLQLEHVIGGSGRVHEVVARAGLSDHEDKDKQKTIFDFKFKINRFQIFKKDKRIGSRVLCRQYFVRKKVVSGVFIEKIC